MSVVFQILEKRYFPLTKMEITSEYIDARYKMESEKVHQKMKEFSWMDVILNELKNKIENNKRLQLLQEDVNEKERMLKLHLEKIDLLKETLKYKQERITEIEGELQNLDSVKEDALKELKVKEEHVIDIWKAQRIAMLYYKENLGIQLKVVDDIITVKFTSISEDEKKKYLVKLTLKDGKWNCVDIIPKFKGREAFIDLLKETNDIQGFLVCIRKEFKEIHKHL